MPPMQSCHYFAALYLSIYHTFPAYWEHQHEREQK